jgi:D-glycero-D-manno-heptose 1,7-bisphosphate phosphatase
MRLLVHAPSLERAPRMLSAAWSLGLRGHDVCWYGGPRPAGADAAALGAPRPVARARDAARVDALIAGGDGVTRAAWAGWMAGAHGAVLDLDPARVARWSFLDHAAWGALDGMGVLEPVVGDDLAAALPGFDPERLRVWSSEPAPESPDVAHPDVEVLERACERLASRQRGTGLRPAVFLDRDGTLVVEVGYLANADDIQLLPGVAPALRELRAAGYALVVVSNQSGVGRGLFPLSRVYEAMARLRRELRTHGVELDAIYFCPHRPDADCTCRKPKSDLLRQATANLRLSLRESAMVGDKRLDAETGRRAGARGVLVRTGYGRDEEQREPGAGDWPAPAHVANDLADAVPWLIEQHPGAHTV